MSDYGCVNAKIGVLRRGIFKSKDYETMIAFSERKDLLEYIGSNPLYKREYDIYVQDHIKNRLSAESMILKSQVAAVNKLRHLANGKAKDIVKGFLLKFEIEDLKLILRSLVTGAPVNKNDFISLDNSVYLNHNQLLQCSTIEEMISKLEGTPLRKVIYTMDSEQIKRRHFHVEMHFDMLFFEELFNISKDLDSKDKMIFDTVMGKMIDRINVLWIYRAKKYYNLTNEEIFNYALRNGKTIKADKLKELIYSASVESFMSVLSNTPMGKFMVSQDENEFYHYSIIKYSKKEIDKLMNFTSDIGTILKFILELEFQSMNLVRIVEALKYDMDKTWTHEHILV